MAVVVVGGNGRGVGKTALVCGLIAALPEIAWTAVKITSHGHEGHRHERHEPIWEETEAGQGTDTARYLAAGARRAFFITAKDDELAQRLAEFWKIFDPSTHILFESNRVVEYVKPDLCIAIDAGPDDARKSSFRLVERRSNAVVRLGKMDSVERIPESGGAEAAFQLAGFERISPPMQQWLRTHLKERA
jgi:hypothetical protein